MLSINSWQDPYPYVLSWPATLATLILFACAPSPAVNPSPDSPRHQEDLLCPPALSATTDSLSFEAVESWYDTALACPPQPIPAARVINNGPRRQPWVALTFDACPTTPPMRIDADVLRTLVELRVPATLFLSGRWMEKQPEIVHYLASIPHFELAIHGHRHHHMQQLSAAAVRRDLWQAQELLWSLTGRQALLFRPPYGEWDQQLLDVAAPMGLTTVNFDLASGDADRHLDPQKIVTALVALAQPGSIIVMHINGHGWRTAAFLPHLIAQLRQKGLQPVTVGQLLRPAAT